MFRQPFAVAALASLLAAGAASAWQAAPAPREAPRGFSGRSGATRVVLVASCGRPEPQAGLTSELAGQVQFAQRRAFEQRLRKLVEQGSSDWLRNGRTPRDEIDEFVKQLPPKYQQLIKEYFEKLDKTQNGKK